MQSELDLYSKSKAVAIAHTGDTAAKTINAFAVGYWDILETDNGEVDKERATYFYSEKWYLKKQPKKVEIDYPFVLMLPPRSSGTIKKGDSSRRFKMVLVIVDLLHQDREGNDKTAQAKRSKEEVWASCAQIGEEYIKELCSFVAGDGSNIKMIGDFSMERYYQKGTDRMAGVEIELEVQLNYCYTGSFDYEKVYLGCGSDAPVVNPAPDQRR